MLSVRTLRACMLAQHHVLTTNHDTHTHRKLALQVHLQAQAAVVGQAGCGLLVARHQQALEQA